MFSEKVPFLLAKEKMTKRMILEKFVKIWKKEELSVTELETRGAFFR